MFQNSDRYFGQTKDSTQTPNVESKESKYSTIQPGQEMTTNQHSNDYQDETQPDVPGGNRNYLSNAHGQGIGNNAGTFMIG